jgi:23S rRNA G2445 N2-methylase RlmL
MTTYTLDIIPGTTDFVMSDLTSKHNNVKVRTKNENQLEFESEENDVDKFMNVYSALRIHKLHGPSRNIFRREWKRHTVPAGINPALAYILCMVAKVSSQDIVYDPFCGAGTILITAEKFFNAEKILGSDLSGNAVDWTIENAQIAGVPKKKVTIFRSNISQVKLQDESVDKVITNPPYGIRSKSHAENIKIYESFLKKSYKFLKTGGSLVCITQEKDLFISNAEMAGFGIHNQIDIKQSGLFLTIFDCQKIT